MGSCCDSRRLQGLGAVRVYAPQLMAPTTCLTPLHAAGFAHQKASPHVRSLLPNNRCLQISTETAKKMMKNKKQKKLLKTADTN